MCSQEEVIVSLLNCPGFDFPAHTGQSAVCARQLGLVEENQRAETRMGGIDLNSAADGAAVSRPLLLRWRRRRSATPWIRRSSGSTTIVLAIPWCSSGRGGGPWRPARPASSRARNLPSSMRTSGKPLVMRPWGIHRGPRLHAELEQIQDHPERGVGDGPAARRPGDNPDIVPLPARSWGSSS